MSGLPSIDRRRRLDNAYRPPKPLINPKDGTPVKPPIEEPPIKPLPGEKMEIHLKFKVPKGKIANIMGVMNLLQMKFNSLELELTAKEGSISQQDFEDKIEEAFRQLGIKINV